MKSIYDTKCSEYFDDVSGLNINLHDEKESEVIFRELVSTEGTSWFDLPDQCWLVTSEKSNCGRWLESYNNKNLDEVSSAMSEHSGWVNSEVVYFISGYRCVLSSSWGEFLDNWNLFLSFYDDCPIVVDKKASSSAFIFTPMGAILSISG